MNTIDRNWCGQVTADYRADYPTYNTRPEFDEGFDALDLGIFACPYDGSDQPGYRALAWEQGFECATRLRFFFKWHRPLGVYKRWWA